MKQSLLWKLSKDQHQDSFLVGTMHVKSESAFNRLNQIIKLLGEVDLFAAEYDLDILSSSGKQGDMMMSQGKHIRDMVTPARYKRLKKQLDKSFGINIDQLGRFLPLILVNFISESTLEKDFNLPLDMHLWKHAKEEGLSTIGIESYDSQIEIIKKIKLKHQVKMITEIARNPAKFRKNILRMAEWYRQEEIIKLYKNGKKSLGKYKDLLLKNRNYIIAERFEELTRDHKTLFAFGAGHLAGKDGVLKLLKDKDWKLKAI
jgi:uncharacterized protein YbaP (TraB family)